METLSEGPSQAAECGYVEADETAQQATEDYYNTPQTRANRARLQELWRAKEAAETRREYAAQCEERARNWADLLAQQQSARAAVNTALTAQTAIIWTFFEILALVFTIGVGMWAISVTRQASRNEIAVARQIGQAQVRAYLSVKEVKVHCNGTHKGNADSIVWSITVENTGQSPARAIRAVISGAMYVNGHEFDVLEETDLVDTGGNTERPTERHSAALTARADDIRATLRLGDGVSGNLTVQLTYCDVFWQEDADTISTRHHMTLYKPDASSIAGGVLHFGQTG
ncbi:MAG: hypothetical protein M0D54_17445 [Hyphomonadaceae bacterium JAD_PAG50586_4]|nr:MAG: hypothetical protein M0D54_17445 [Hyphomonadaceae bacterium JAD_PAG50586_4]